MSDDSEIRLQRALGAMRSLRKRVEELEAERSESIAIVGLSCRFPGAADAGAFWQLLKRGGTAISSLEARFDAQALAGIPGHAGLLESIDQFDPSPFGMAPKEAASLDPQQRLLLEVSWEALENAGYAPSAVPVQPVGVFVGLTSVDFRELYQLDPIALDAHCATGAANCFAAGRLSYCLGLEGPALVVDTACSSSLVAVHLACQSLRSGESRMALAGGVNILASPLALHLVAKTGALSADGQCRAFDAAANGFVRGEGAGVVVLKRLSDALKDGDNIWAVIRGSAVNQDGRSMNLTSPNGEAQTRLLKAALDSAKLNAADVGYVEAHGTGTQLGDPIEIDALREAFEQGSDAPLYVGSVKANIGHLEAAAGIAGLIKVVLALNEATVPMQPGFAELNPRIDLSASRLRVPTAAMPWVSERMRVAGVSSFGMSGTNAHVLLQQAPPRAAAAAEHASSLQLLTLSAKTPQALLALAERQRDALAALEPSSFADFCFTANTGRSRFRRRIALVADSSSAMAARLAELAQDFAGERSREEPGKILYLFTGQGSVYPGMGRELYESQPTVRRTLQQCDEILRPLLSVPLLDVLFSSAEAAGLITRTEYAQPALFALEYALATLWSSWGLRPAMVLGHSVGEYAAACFAGMFTLEDGLRFIARRGALMQTTAPGAMATLFTDVDRVRRRLGRDSALCIAALNARESVVVSGPLAELEELCSAFKAEGVSSKRLAVSQAFHSSLMDPILDELEREGAKVTFKAPSLPLLTNLEGTLSGPGKLFGPAYLRRHAREPVLFQAAFEAALAAGASTLIEVGPSATLIGLGKQIAGERAVECAVPSLRRAQHGLRTLLEAAAKLYQHGHDLDWGVFHAETKCRRVPLPTYPFQRARYWFVPRASAGSAHALELPRPSQPASAASSGPPSCFVHTDSSSGKAHELGRSASADELLPSISLCVARVMHLAPGALHPGDSLRDLGLDSLLAVELKSRLDREFDVAVPLVAFLDVASVSALSRLVAELRASTPSAAAVSDVTGPLDSGAGFALTDLQQAYLVGRGEAFGLGNVSTYFLLEFELEDLDIERLSRAFGKLIERHGMLRAVISPDGEQRVLEQVPLYRLPCRDLRGCSHEQREAALLAIRKEMSEQTFDTTRWPLFDVRVTRTEGSALRLHVGFDALIVDAWSLSLLFREWSALYREPTAALPALGLTYREYLAAVDVRSRGSVHESALRYWRARLDTLPAAPDLPLAMDPGQVKSPRFRRRTARLAPELLQGIKRWSVANGLSTSAAVCTAYAEALALFSKSPKFTLNLLVLNRVPVHEDVMGIVGNCSATLLLEVELSPGVSFADQANKLQRQLWQDLEHSSVSGVAVLRELNRKQSGVARVVMPVVFASTLNFDAQGVDADFRVSFGGPVKQVHGSLRTPQVWLDHQVIEEDGELVVNFDSVDDLFPAGLVEEIFAGYVELLTRLGHQESAWSAPAEVRLAPHHLALRHSVNDTAGEFRQELLHAPFLERAALRPNDVAVVFAGRGYTYGELDDWSERIGAWLIENGAVRNRLVALVMEKGIQQVVGALAVLKSGAAYVPIDARLPRERLEYLLGHAQPSCVLTHRSAAEKATLPQSLPCFDVDRASSLPSVAGRSKGPAQPTDLAYVIYTSGSTGMPKGVMIEHRAALNTVLDVNQRLGVTPADRIFALSQFSFDLSVYDLFGMLAAGAALVIPEAAETREPSRWLPLLVSERVSLWNTVPALMEMLVDHVSGSPEAERLALRHVMLSGDSIPVSLPERIREIAPGARCTSLGGATEASIWSIWYPIEEVDPSWTSIPYGKPMRNQRFDVLDAALRPRPIGVAGDLYIAGDGLARGYFRDEEKTRTSFLERASTGERLYKTGDLGRYLPDGNIEFLGREDFQVKISGHRVELGEVEVALGQEQGVKAVVASAIGPRGAKRLIAYVVPEPGRALSEAELSRALARKLPAYAVPSRILTLDSLPLTSNGKVDRRLLPDPGAVPQATEHSPPRSETERVLAELWQTLLATSDFGVRDNFFAMGGQSLLAVRLMTQLKQRCGVALPLSALFEHPTIEALAKLVDQGQAKSRRAALVTVRAQGRETPWFFVHPVGGDVLCYAELSAAFGENQPFFALQTPELPAEAAAPTSIEGMAALYEAALREVRPKGPYRVGGWSMGGVVAYELGQRLRRSGEAVESLVLVDVTMAPVGARAEVDDAWFLAAFARDLGGLAQTDLRFEARELRELDEPARWARVLAGVRAGRLMAEEPDAASLQLYFKRFRANYRAMLDYQALPYHGALLFLRATEHGATRAVAQDWCALSTSAELVDVAGDHYAITRSATARAIVEQIQASSRSVKSASRAGPRSAGSSPMNQQITPNDGE